MNLAPFAYEILNLLIHTCALYSFSPLGDSPPSSDCTIMLVLQAAYLSVSFLKGGNVSAHVAGARLCQVIQDILQVCFFRH